MTDTNVKMNVQCPRCGRIWTAMPGEPDVECNCHRYCDDGMKPSDCTLVSPTDSSAIGYWDGNWGWPVGLHTGDAVGGEDIFDRVAYCTTHDKWIMKRPLLLPCDWARWHRRRAPKRLRMSLGQY